MQKKLSKQNNSGFTLSEVLIAVAILIVLMGLAMIPITRHQRDLRQTELDAKAEIVYHAAQNKLSELLANGRISDCYAEDLQPLNNTPLDAAERKTSLHYVTSAAKTGEGSAAAAILPEDQVDRQLWDNHWVIELDPASGSVYAVFYSEKPLTYDFDSFNPLRFRDGRLSAGATVGYYGGDSVQSEITGKLTPHMEIINKEQLLLRVTCDTPMEPLHFYVTVSDGVHSTSRIELTGSEVKTDYLTYTATMVLDSLTDGMRFGQQARFKSKNLTPGADLTITVEVTCENHLVDSASGTLTANSLFAEVRGGDTAVVTYARHLQNLDTASRLPDSITRAVQEQDIQFVNENADDGWDRLYGSRTFTPITNSRLTYCESKATVNGQVYHPVIYGLTVNTTGDGGLFAAFSGTLKNLRLCGADITASGNAGGLAGRLSGKTEILDCQVYLSPTRDKLSTKTEQDIWLRGSTAGGLAGRCDGTLTIRRSFAATVIQGVRYAGGLVGNTDSAALTVDHSYADCYLYAAANNGVAGGLIGACNGTANIALSNCYAAGFQSAGTTAGLSGGELSGGELSGGDSLKACYSACVRLGTDMKLTYSTVKPPAAGTAPADIDAVYYMFPSRNDLSGTSFVNYAKWSGQNRAEGVKVLGTAFTAETSDTVAYNLMDNMGLSTYSYPRLTGLPHYGDWQADFESGALAYYEKYSDGTYGFLGANRSTLRSGGTVVDDGYGMVYRTQPTDAITVAYTLGDTARTATLRNSIKLDSEYWLVRLPDELVYTNEVSPTFYRQVTVDDISYFFNPHFACRVIQSAALPSAPAEVGIRTARHLHDLSLYYDTYRTLLDKTAVFRQERPIDYNSYARLTVHTQPPIGAADGKPFIHTYDGGGYTIAAPSFTGTVNTDGTSYAGMFGLNRGTLRNIILLTANKDRTVSLEGQLSLQTACIGALTGCNEGTVYNCAAAGFSVNGDARHGSILYLGGLVGRNSGTVRASGVSAPRLFANSLYATLCAGGFAGGNSGVVQQCYAMADIEIGTINGGGVTLGGFAGSNTGSLRASYCATAMTSPNADIHGFAPTAGGVSGCCYLNGGTYRFVDSVHLYQYTDRSGAAPVNEPALRGMATRLGGFGAVSAANTFQHDKTLDSAGKAYPYPGIVAGHDGSRVHYGDWVTPADMGVLGLLYWEYESKPTGSGYYFSSIGVEDGEYKTNSSLCVSHDDGGTVTAYGYGYYWSAGSTTEPVLSTGITMTDNSKNRQFLGEAAIGGLVGVSSANLNRCSAVVKLNINCTHRYASETNTGAMNKAQWGNYVRVGGLVGGVRYDVSDCYTGGSITVANDLLNERILTGDGSNTSFVDRYESTPKSVKMTQGGAEAGPDTYVYIGGIGGSGFSATFANFSGSKDGQPTYNNCYTYMTFPAMEGTITGISLIGSIADRAGVNGGTAQLTINNCYYLDSSAAISFNNLPTFYSKFNRTWSPSQWQYIYTYYSLATLLSTDTARMDMLRGDLSYLSKYTWNTGSSPYTINGLTALSYEQMSGRADIDGKSFTALLNGGSDDGSFHWVTTEENGQSAHGKYSFPGSAAALRGQDYPFPTVLTQGTACLHYGEWPSRGLYWSSGVLSLDRITTPNATLSLHFTQDIGTDATPTITCSRNGIVDVSVPQAQTPPADVRHSYTVTLTGLSVGSTEVFATLGDYTARLLVSVTSTLDISVDGLPGDDFFVGDPCNLTLTARDSRGSALDVEWTVTPQHGNSVLTASAPAVDAGGTASVTLTAAGEGEDRTLITAAYTAPGGETFTSQLPLIIPVRMQGVLGIANTSGEPSVYWQGVMDRDGTAFTDDVPSGAPYTDRPAYAGAKLYLYSRGSAATFDGLSVSGVTVKGGADATEYVLRPMPVSNDEDTSVLHPDVFRAENDDFRVTVGTPAKDTTSAFTYRPLTVKGRSQGQITLTVTLTDAENHAFTLSIPYTLTEEDTRVTATLRVDEQALTLSVPYGTAPTAEDVARLLTDNGISPDTIDSWTPDITQPLYADTAFTAVRKTADSGGAPTVPDADIPASGSKDPEDTPSDDPSAPDSSSSGTDPTPEPSPDTLP